VVDGRRRRHRGRHGRFDVALFVGYHARAGHPTGTIAHTYTGGPVETRLNGRPTASTGSTRSPGRVGDPRRASVAGDDALAAEVEGWLPWAERIVVKEGFGSNAAASLTRSGPEADPCRPTAAVERRGPASSGPGGRAARSRSRSTTGAGPRGGLRAIVPDAERIGDRTVRHPGPDPITAYRGFLAGVRLASLVE
jgi:D-amino peptidase